MKTLTIIGNGFDLHHNLPTSYEAFINSNSDIYEKKYKILSGCDEKNKNWSDIEGEFKKYLLNLYDEMCDLYYPYYDLDYISSRTNEHKYIVRNERIAEIFSKLDELNSLLFSFEKEFQSYLKQKCNIENFAKIIANPKIAEIFENSDMIVSFNYTKTIEQIYGRNDVFHVHGEIDSRIYLGPTFFEDEISEINEIIESTSPRNYELKKLKIFFEELQTKVKDRLDFREGILRMIAKEEYIKVYILGHSLGDIDISFFNILSPLAMVYVTVYSEKDRVNIQRRFDTLDLDYEIIDF